MGHQRYQDPRVGSKLPAACDTNKAAKNNRNQGGKSNAPSSPPIHIYIYTYSHVDILCTIYVFK